MFIKANKMPSDVRQFINDNQNQSTETKQSMAIAYVITTSLDADNVIVNNANVSNEMDKLYKNITLDTTAIRKYCKLWKRTLRTTSTTMVACEDNPIGTLFNMSGFTKDELNGIDVDFIKLCNGYMGVLNAT
jgi:hypothetical protein